MNAAENAVAQRLLLLSLGQSQHQNRQNHRVIGAEQPLEKHQKADSHQI